jgi:hypothetical protein
VIKLSIEPCKVPLPEYVSDWLIKRSHIGIEFEKYQDNKIKEQSHLENNEIKKEP